MIVPDYSRIERFAFAFVGGGCLRTLKIFFAAYTANCGDNCWLCYLFFYGSLTFFGGYFRWRSGARFENRVPLSKYTFACGLALIPRRKLLSVMSEIEAGSADNPGTVRNV